MIDLTPGTPFHPFVDAVSKAAGEVLSQALGTKWMVEIDTVDGTRFAETPVLCFQLSASGGLQGDALIRIRTTDALLLAQRFLTESIDPSAELNPARKKAVEELVGKIAGSAASYLKESCGDTELSVNSVEPPNWQGVEIALLASEPSSAKLVLGLMLGREMLASVKTELQVQTQGADAATGGDSHQQKFDLLLDVDVSLTLRFGQRMLTLREILDLTSGSIVELDREVQEPADLLLGDKLIARGQVVIVDGNYGIRITEVRDVRQ
ncbi:MAG: FliM/FliN family flagellar motor switch protein [Candidatus Sulfotelmatobacter sp.]|jgi:flagellar motor switch protein FliN/FliY